jgi:hypothetical protein
MIGARGLGGVWGALPPVACGDTPRDIFETEKQGARR